MFIERITSIQGCILAIYYCSDEVYRFSIITNRGKILDFNDIFFCSQLALNQGKAVIKIVSK